MSGTEANKTGKVVPKKKSKAPPTSEKQDGVALDSITPETKSDKEDKKDERETGEKSGSKTDKLKVSEKDIKNGKGKLKDGDKSKDGKGTEERGGKDEPKSKSSKEVIEKRKSDEPPRHPGFIVWPKSTKDSKLRSLSLSLDALLDYTDKDVEDSTLELSLFAESFYEMLKFQMGRRIFTFLQKLRTKFVIKRAQRKRPREDGNKEDNVKKLSAKRLKVDEKDNVKSEPTNVDASNPTQADDEKNVTKKDNSSDKEDDVKMEEGMDEEEDPEEDPEEYEEKENGSPQHDSSTDKNVEQDANLKIEPENMTSNEKAADKTSKGETKVKEEVKDESKSDAKVNEEKEGMVDKNKKETPVKEFTVDRELLQAFRFFDRNRAGYIRVEDMRIVIHNLGMFLSHRDVKELVQSALLESNTGRDDRILYNKLVRMNDL